MNYKKSINEGNLKKGSVRSAFPNIEADTRRFLKESGVEEGLLADAVELVKKHNPDKKGLREVTSAFSSSYECELLEYLSESISSGKPGWDATLREFLERHGVEEEYIEAAIELIKMDPSRENLQETLSALPLNPKQEGELKNTVEALKGYEDELYRSYPPELISEWGPERDAALREFLREHGIELEHLKHEGEPLDIKPLLKSISVKELMKMYGATDEEYEKIERIVYDDPRAYGAVWYPKKVLESVYEFMRAYPKQEIERKIGEADEKRKTKISRLSTYLGMNISDIIGMLFGSAITLVGMRYGWGLTFFFGLSLAGAYALEYIDRNLSAKKEIGKAALEHREEVFSLHSLLGVYDRIEKLKKDVNDLY